LVSEHNRSKYITNHVIETWNDIYYEYIDLTGDAETKYYISLILDISKLQYIISVETDIEMYLLPQCPEKEKGILISIIKDKGFDLKVSYSKLEEFELDRNRILSKLAPIKIQFETKLSELNNYNRSNENVKPNEKGFNLIIAALWKYYGQPIKEKEITAYDFCILFNNYIEYNKQINSSQDFDKPIDK